MPASKKIIVNTLEEHVVHEYDSAQIFTPTYSAKIKPRSIHVPTSAKVIFVHKNVMTALLVQMPIIKVDKDGQMHIHTHTNYKVASMANMSEFLEHEDIKLLKAQLSAVRHKKAFGASPIEVIKEQELSSEIEMVRFMKKIKNFTEGGGF